MVGVNNSVNGYNMRNYIAFIFWHKKDCLIKRIHQTQLASTLSYTTCKLIQTAQNDINLFQVLQRHLKTQLNADYAL
jgi:hypothetical protein